jgi:sortase B
MKRKKRRSRSKADIITGVLYVLFGLIVTAALYGVGRLAYLAMGTTVGNHYYAALAEKTVSGDQVDFPALAAKNPEICAWVRVDDAAISLPVVRTKDNSYYLTHLFDERKNKLGTPFIDAGNAGDFSDRHTVIYGHALKSGAMFGFLWEYENPNYFSRHPQILLDLPDGRQLALAVFACSRIEGVRGAIPIAFDTEASFLSFIDDLHETSAFFNNIKLTTSDRIVSFCVVLPDGGEGRLLVSCKIVENGASNTATGADIQEVPVETTEAGPEEAPAG